MVKEYLNPNRKLVDEVVGWLLGRVRDANGVRSLAHLMVVVPTAQSGRNLRLALAMEASRRGWQGILPPKVVLPMQLVKPADAKYREATSVEAAAAFQQYVKTHREDVLALDRLVLEDEFDDLSGRFALFDQMQDIWRALAGRGYLMRDVPIIAKDWLEQDFGDEMPRWEQLAELEKGYFDYLHENGICSPTELVNAAKTKAAIVASEIEEIVVPALADPIRVLGDVLEQQDAAGKRVSVLLHASETDADRFDEWGWPRAKRWVGRERPILERLKDGDITCAADGTRLSRIVAGDYPPAESGAELPALALCDGELFQSMAAAFLNRGYTVHNPERHFLARSSLGRLMQDLMALYVAEEWPWQEFVGVLRSNDVTSALGLSAGQRAELLAGVDIVQNAYIPRTISRGMAFPENSGVKAWQKEQFDAFCEVGRKLEEKIAEARTGASLSQFLRAMLKWTFAKHLITDEASDKEFLAAVNGAREFLNGLEGEFVSSLALTNAEFGALAKRELEAVVYSLEPDADNVIKTEGWLELSWSFADRIALAGLHEGKVPDSIIGHPFLPDALRKELGLVTNEDRLARDTWILKELLDSHGQNAIRVYVARGNDDGDICRPSRLLYLCADGSLAERIKGLFGDLPEERVNRARKVEWQLNLPDEIKTPGYFSPSAIDTYVKCPFTYLLENGLGMRPYREKRELEANDFGTFVHDVMEEYAKRQIESGDEQLTDAKEIRRVMAEEIVPAVRSRYGRTTLNIDLQLKAAEGRLLLLAEAQAQWARDGWRIRMVERPIDAFVPELGFKVHGRIDRVDENINAEAQRHWCLIDYKTWDDMKLNGRVYTSGKASDKRLLSVQLPMYGRGLAAIDDRVAWSDVQFCYCILGKNADNVGFCKPLGEDVVEASIETAKRAAELIGKNIFWPPGPGEEWRWRLSGLFVSDPKKDIGETEWARRQEKKLEAENV